MKAVVAIALLGCAACAGRRAPLVAKPLVPHADDHGLGRIGPCLDGAEADRTKIDLPPTLIGRVVGVYPDGIAVAPEHAAGAASVDVPISDGTVLCTVAGGAVQRPDLTVGLHVAVWLPSSRHPALGAVAVMLAAREPGVGWPDAIP